jgi:lysophospholipase L1-like esterase
MQKGCLYFVFLLLSHWAYTQPFIKEIEAFEKDDSLHKPATGQVLLVGSSTFRLWKTSKEDLAGYPIINRGFGGSQMSDVNFYFDRIVSKYQPKLILVYEGDNDLAAGKTPETILEDFKIFADKIKKQVPNAIVGYCSVRPSIARTNIREKQKTVNKLIEDYCKQQKRFYFIDIQKEYYLPNGELMPDVFVADQLHLNEKGYKIWTLATRKFLKKRFKA